MAKDKIETRTEATKPAATKHLSNDQKLALDLQADAEHTDGQTREDQTRKIGKLGNGGARDGTNRE